MRPWVQAQRRRCADSVCAASACLQVTDHCEERGRLMADVWIGYAAMLDRWLDGCLAAWLPGCCCLVMVACLPALGQ